MNWYKKATEFYDQIGHSPTYPPSVMWIYHQGKLLTHIIKSQEDHLAVWNDMEDSDYRGRYEPDSKLVSIINPFEGKPIPNPILRALYDTFGNNIKIIEF